MKNKKSGIVLLTTLFVALLFSCVSSKGAVDSDPAVGRGISAWNSRGPASASAHWEEIKDSTKQKKWLNYVNVFNDGTKKNVNKAKTNNVGRRAVHGYHGNSM